MRCLFYAVFIVVIHLTSNTVTATAHSDTVELATLNDIGFLRVETRSLAEEPRTRLLRVNDAVDDNLRLGPAANQERELKASPISKLGEKLKTTNTAKKLLATAKKTSGTFKMIPGVTTVKNRLLYNKF
ncbi:hypothetical protein JG687_00010429 [Phytophthora cactorum]|uniref:RxLR effector protein n=1 Tax=Phytophthora cactorum TaxID=29920 RepID=A0A8T1UBY9_9STRA|nr:hypothetical protein JG687_00010429 [Phytophthora cactorum]